MKIDYFAGYTDYLCLLAMGAVLNIVACIRKNGLKSILLSQLSHFHKVVDLLKR